MRLGGFLTVTREKQEHSTRFDIRTGGGGEPCWFCDKNVEPRSGDTSGDAAALLVHPLGGGESIKALCHRACVERAKGSLAF